MGIIRRIWNGIKKIFGFEYDSEDIDDQIEVDHLLEDFRNSIKNDARDLEDECIEEMDKVFDKIKRIVQERYPEYVPLIEQKNMDADKRLKGSIIKYVKQKMSKNNEDFAEALSMSVGMEKQLMIENKTKEILDNAERNFYRKFNKEIDKIEDEIIKKVNERLDENDKQVNDYIFKIKEMKNDSKKNVDIYEKARIASVPVIESSEAIIQILK
jgi:hypothetical protein